MALQIDANRALILTLYLEIGKTMEESNNIEINERLN